MRILRGNIFWTLKISRGNVFWPLQSRLPQPQNAPATQNSPKRHFCRKIRATRLNPTVYKTVQIISKTCWKANFSAFVNASLSTPITYQSSPKFLPYFYQNRPRWSLPGFSPVDDGCKVRRVPLPRYAPRGRKSGTKSCHFDLFVYFCSVARWGQWIRDCL